MNRRIPVVIPVLDEAQALPAVLTALSPRFRAVVVDNGSTDDSAAIAARFGADVVFEPCRGFGSACWTGLNATDPLDSIVCFMDGDASLDPADLERVVGPVASGQADLVLGARHPLTRAAWSAHARAANWLLARAVRQKTGYTVTDLGPMRAARRDDLIGLGIVDRRFGWPLEMVLRAAAAGWRVVEVPVAYRPRVGQSKVTGTVRGTVRTVQDMSRILRRV